MKVFIIHDEAGRIQGTVASTEQNVGIRVPAGSLVHSRDETDLAGSELQRYLRDLHENHRVTTPGEPALVRVRPRGNKE